MTGLLEICCKSNWYQFFEQLCMCCTQWIASAKVRAKTVFCHLKSHCSLIMNTTPLLQRKTERRWNCVIPENVHTSPTEGIFSKTPPPLWKFQLSFIHFFILFGLTEPPTPSPRKFQSLLWGEYGYFLELHNEQLTQIAGNFKVFEN